MNLGKFYTADKLDRASVTANAVVVDDSMPNAINQYTSIGGVSLGYDDQFNLKAYNGLSANYDPANRMVSASRNGSTAQFVYDGLGRCVKRTIGSVTTLIAYDGWKPAVEWDGAGNLRAWNVYGAGADEILWRYQVDVGHLRYHHDANGNVAFVLGGGGERLEKYSYDAFGQPTVVGWTGTAWDEANPRMSSDYGNRFLFQGREWIPELGIYDYRNRFYHPGLGRFLQTDPIGFDAGDMNLFRYCGDDPVNRSDPLGLESDEYWTASPRMLRLSIQATKAAAKQYAKTKDGIGWAVWGANRKDGTGVDPFWVQGVRTDKPKWAGPRRMVVGHEYEKTPDVNKSHPGKYDRWAYNGHIHGRKADPDWSGPDIDTARKGVVVTKANWNDLDKDGNIRPGHSIRRLSGVRDGKPIDERVYTAPGSTSRNSSNDSSSYPSAAQIDALHQGTGAPSLAAESVNFAPGAR